jgi:hypothetical protein
MKYLKNFSSIAEAELAKNVLKEHNIESWVQKKGANYPGDLGDNYGADLFVNEKDIEEAKNLLDSEPQ